MHPVRQSPANGSAVLIKQRRSTHRPRTRAVELHCRSYRKWCGVRSADRNHDAQVLDLRVVDHVVNAIHGCMRHVLRFEPFHPVVQRMTHKSRIQLQAQRFVLGDTLLAGVKARVAG